MSPQDELAEMLKQAVEAIDQLAAAVNAASDKEEKIGRVVLEWLEESDNPNLDPATRATYFECAEKVVEIFKPKDDNA